MVCYRKTLRKGTGMTVYIANINGDWWEHKEGDSLFVLDSSDLPDYIDPEDIEGDKFENLIIEYGTEFSLRRKIQNRILLGRKTIGGSNE